MIKEILVCDKCGYRTEIDECDTPDTAIHYSDWVENPDDGYEHFCGQCAKDKNLNK